ncbi:hypothetical protein SLEP1_g22584 [Rubroshorea leprosula]|uniref:Uncharacterized protein n=1 Tax=Rubroshorea leprosula TaxID=152421 RepID=A0AAV5JLN1_9ROSI|nr:hypothetical protein SLEP1_g22584 [Rubroshorea leprosula]
MLIFFLSTPPCIPKPPSLSTCMLEKKKFWKKGLKFLFLSCSITRFGA